MGVLACSRRGCENVMCDRYSPTFGYICYSCYQELIESGPQNIHIFMDTRKVHNINPEGWTRFVELEFEIRDEI